MNALAAEGKFVTGLLQGRAALAVETVNSADQLCRRRFEAGRQERRELVLERLAHGVLDRCLHVRGS